MKCKLYLLCALALLPFSNIVAETDEASMLRSLDEFNTIDKENDWENCGSKLKLLCALIKSLHTKCITTRNMNVAQNLCAHAIKATNLQANRLDVVERACFNDITTRDICARNLTANNFCTTGTTRFGSFENCQKFRATMVFNADTLYTLGTPVNFNTILDDPNGDVSLVPNTHYTVPVSGYYIVTLQIDQFGLDTTSPVLGIPVANPIITVNGAPFRQAFYPYLAFHNLQSSTISGLVSLNAGDEVSAVYQLYMMSDAGFSPITGTVIIDGNGTEENRSILKIHYLSSNCLDLPCEPCVPEPCEPICIECPTCAPCCA